MVKNCDLEAVGRGQHFQDLDQIIQNLMHHGSTMVVAYFSVQKKISSILGRKEGVDETCAQ